MAGDPAIRFQVVRELGRGGMGAVELVEDAARAERVARKRVLRALDPRALLRFKREFRAVERLWHPALVRLHELGEDAEGLFFTMEAIEGVDLVSYVTRAGPALATSSAKVGSSVRTIGAAADTQSADGSSEIGPAGARAAPASAPPQVDLGRLAHVLPQLLEGLAFLHAGGLVHRDLKPANVLVSRDGGLKLLDFGILAEIGREEGAGEIVGTVGHMAPEQARGAPATPATDRYALGALLFQIFAGRLPFEGPAIAVLSRALCEDAPSLRAHAPEAPDAVVAACDALLLRDADRRPRFEALARDLLPAIGARAPVFTRPAVHGADLVGRDAELAALSGHLAVVRTQQSRFVLVRGPSGVGKSALVEAFAQQAERTGAVVLRGRARASERVAFGGLDEAVDALALRLASPRRGRRQPDELEEDASDRALAAALFPVLSGPAGPAAGQVGRSVAVSALSRLAQRVASRASGLVWVVDDLQWADDDALAVLAQLVELGPEGVFFLATERDDVGPPSERRRLLDGPAGEVLCLRGLDEEALASIVREVAGVEVDRERVGSLAALCGGRPLLAEVLARAIGAGQGEVADPRAALARSIGGAGEAGQRAVALSLAYDGWLGVSDLAAAMRATVGACEDVLGRLALAGIVRRAGPVGPEGRVDLYHDAVRVAAQGVLGSEVLRGAHDALVCVVEARGDAADRVVRHLLGAGREAEAAVRAVPAAAQAERGGAYALASELYAVALRLPGEKEGELRRARAHVLDRAARYAEAAREWSLVARAATTPEERRAAAVSEACSLLSANDVVAGRARLDEVLRASGAPTTRSGAGGLFAGIRFLLGPSAPPRRARPLALPPPGVSAGVEAADLAPTSPRAGAAPCAEPHRVALGGVALGGVAPGGVAPAAAAARGHERDVRVGIMVGYFDPLAGIRLLRRTQAACDRACDRERAAWIDLVFAYFALFGARKAGAVPLADRYVASARARLEGRAPATVEVAMLPRFLDGIAAQRDGRWADAERALEEGVDAFEARGLHGTFEHMMAMVHRAQIPYYAQRTSDALVWLGRFAEAARASDDSALRCHVDFLRVQCDVLAGSFDDARRLGREVRERWRAEATFQRFVAEVETALPDIYIGDCHEATARIRRAERSHARFRPLASMYGGGFATIAALCEANALRTGSRAASGRRVRALARLAASAPPLATTGALRACAYVADARGEPPERALRLLEDAETRAASLGQPVDAAIARYQRGLRLGGDEGARLCAQAAERTRAAGASERLLPEDAGRR